MEVDNIASEVNVQGGNNTISNGNRTVHNNLTVNIENYYVPHNDSQQPAHLLRHDETNTAASSYLSQLVELVELVELEREREQREREQHEREQLEQLEREQRIREGLEASRIQPENLLRLSPQEEFLFVLRSNVTHEDIEWLTKKTAGYIQPQKRLELYEHLGIDVKEAEEISRSVKQQGAPLEKEVFTILEYGLLDKEKRSRAYLLEKLTLFDRYLARSYLSYLVDKERRALLKDQDVMWLTDQVVGGICFDRVYTLYELLDIDDNEINRIRNNFRKEYSAVDEVFLILYHGLRLKQKTREYLLEKLCLFSKDLGLTFKEYLSNH